MPLSLLVPPASEPVSLAELKSYLRVEHADEDALIERLIVAARAACEARTRRAFLAQTWRLTRPHWPRDGQIDVPLAPLATVAAARSVAADGSATALDVARFTLLAGAAPGLVLVRPPLPAPEVGGHVELDLVAGYGTEAADVPADLAEAVRRLAALYYEHRGASGAADMPADIAGLLAAHRVVSL